MYLKALYLIKALLITMSFGWITSSPLFGSENNQTTFSAWIDSTNSANIKTVAQQAEWQSFIGWKTWGFGPEPIWIRVHIPASESNTAPSRILVVHPPILDYVTFYDPTNGIKKEAGDFLTAKNDALGSVLFTFEISPHTAARDVYLRVQSTSTRVIYLSLKSRNEAEAYTRLIEWSTGSLVVISLMFFCWAAVQYAFSRERLMGVFLIKQGLITVWGFIFLGFARITVGHWFDEGQLSLISSIVVAGVVTTAIWFIAELLKIYGARLWMLRVIFVSISFIALLGLLNFFGHTRLSLQIINTTAPLLLVWVLITLLASPKVNDLLPIPKIVLFGYLLLYVIFNSIPALTYAGLIEGSAMLFVGNMGLLVFDGLMMLIILNIRHRQLAQQHQKISSALTLEQEQSRLNQQYISDQRQLLAMLAHEMKTPLANLRVWMEAGPKGRPVMQQAIEDMNRIIERCIHAGQISDNSLKPNCEWSDIGTLTESVIQTSREPQRVHFKTTVEDSLAFIDKQMLSIILSNLIENAYKYSPSNSEIKIEINQKANSNGVDGWHWSISNLAGEAGFPDPHQVFQKYYRSPQAQRQSGSGLGLFLVKSLATIMQGEVSYTPSESRVQFHLWLPTQYPTQ